MKRRTQTIKDAIEMAQIAIDSPGKYRLDVFCRAVAQLHENDWLTAQEAMWLLRGSTL